MKNSFQNFKNLFSEFKNFSLFNLVKKKNLTFIGSFGLRLCLVVAMSLLAFIGCETDSDDLIFEEENTIQNDAFQEANLIANENNPFISDGANGGTAGFYFLPPMVKSPSYSGTFNAGLSPVVEICETTACTTLHASFSIDEGVGSEMVRIDEKNEHYIVNWHTDKTGTEVGQTYRIRISVAGTVLGHADVQIVSNGKDAKSITDSGGIALVVGRTLPIKFRIEEGKVFVVGSGGGTFTSNDETVTIDVPEGAVDEEIGIIVTPIADELNNPEMVPGTIFEFRPSPYSFNQPVTLTIVYDPANLPAGSSESLLRILKLINGTWVAVAGGSVDENNNRASAPIDSFSWYGVGEDPCAGVQCAEGDFCSGGSCWQDCTEEESIDPENFLCFTGCPEGQILDEENSRCILDPCAGVDCQEGDACFEGSCFDCTGENAADPGSPCYKVCPEGEKWDEATGGCITDLCADVQCGEGYSCHGGACFQDCTEEEKYDPENFLCFEGCPEGEILDEENSRCIVDPCAGVNCQEGYSCYEGSCFLDCTGEDPSDPNSPCYQECPEGEKWDEATGGCITDLCADVQCGEGYSCHGGACFQDCTEEEKYDPENFLCFEGCPEGEILDEENSRCIVDPCAGVNCQEGYSCYEGSCFIDCMGEDLTDPESPCYEGPDPNVLSWHNLGIGVNSYIADLAVYNDFLIAGGNFTSAGGTWANRIARWTGSAWQALGEGLNGEVRGLTIFGNDLIVGGQFSTAGGQSAQGVARWDGSQWHSMGALTGGLVWTLTVYKGELIAGGTFSTADGQTVNRIARWDGEAWHSMDGGMNNTVFDLAVYNGELFAGGLFTTAGGQSISHIARWDGESWQPLGTGMNAQVLALTIYDGALIAGGAFTNAGGQTVDRIARWDGTQWHSIGNGLNGWVNMLTVADGRLVVGGAFTTAGGQAAGRIARLDGSAWQPFGTGVDNRVLAGTVYGNNLIIGGDFTVADGKTANRIARWGTP